MNKAISFSGKVLNNSSFLQQNRDSGAGLHKVLAENTTRAAWDLGKATSPVLPLRIKREQHPFSCHRISWSIGKEAKVQRS